MVFQGMPRYDVAIQTERKISMILADKIIDLRKKNGWSQEELAEKLGVSRQSISKWEGAQSVPDMNRILAMSDLFGVSTDYLLKDALEAERPAELPMDRDFDEPLRRVEMEEAHSFLETRIVASARIALGVALCILSPIVLILLEVAQEYGLLALSENQATGIGLVVLFLCVGAALPLFITSAMRLSKFDALEKQALDTAYGVDGMVRERREQYAPTHTRLLVLGIVLCVLSVLPIFAMLLFFGDDNDFAMVCGAAALLAIVAAGVYMIVRTCVRQAGYNILLQDGDYTPARKAENRRNEPISAIYWALALTIYLAWSFITMQWQTTWIVWPIAGVLYGVVEAVLRLTRKNS